MNMSQNVFVNQLRYHDYSDAIPDIDCVHSHIAPLTMQWFPVSLLHHGRVPCRKGEMWSLGALL